MHLSTYYNYYCLAMKHSGFLPKKKIKKKIRPLRESNRSNKIATESRPQSILVGGKNMQILFKF